MLNQATKVKIDSARDVLVGKVPDPKSQVEQITIALIYKFMDDMDRASEELGGEATFFTGEFKKYSWANIVDNKLSGYDRLNLYAEALEKMNENENIPQLFRNIFKNSFLPYRDPETFNLFTKEINGFEYEHSEDLGDAFEYLLSVMSSQGEAGQFRTPRHIIDFIVDVVNPSKNETILDPACGTAGFLISSYKHIIEVNKETGLTPDEKEKLTNNFYGYDISPDMVRLSLVNLYLHLFPNPKIYEYDTLTNEEKWNESFDVILANPPFMTPKGGIRPHKKFSIQAKRSEVLFVDYIMDHLNINGRGAVIVPDGIVSNKSASAYISLRKKMVQNNYVYMVISLHSDVFKPYAEVKTSILFFDKKLSKKTKDILFLDIENDGYERGNRKRPITGSEIPEITKIAKEYINLLTNDNIAEIDRFINNNNGMLVSKSKIAEDGNYVLRSNKYKAGMISKEHIEYIRLEELIEEVNERNGDEENEVWSVSNEKGFVPTDKYFSNNLKSQNTSKYKKVHERYFAYNPARINVGSLALNLQPKTGIVSPMYEIFKIKDRERLIEEYLYYLLKSEEGLHRIRLGASGAVRQTLPIEDLYEIEIPVPSLEIQKQFIIFHKLIELSKQINETYVPTVDINNEWSKEKLIDHFRLVKGTIPIQNSTPGEYTLVTTAEDFRTCNTYEYDGEAICVPLISASGHGKADINRIYYVQGKFAVGNILMAMIPKSDKVIPKFYYYLLSQEKDVYFTKLMYGSTNVSFAPDDCNELLIPIPDIQTQKQILAKIEEENDIVLGNKKMIELMNNKISKRLTDIWNGTIVH